MKNKEGGRGGFSETTKNLYSNMNPIPISNEAFMRIVKFYLFESPVRTFKKTTKPVQGATVDQPHPKYNYEFKKVSKRGITFADRNLDGPKLNSLRAAMMRVTDVKLINVENELTSTNIEGMVDPSSEYIIIKKNDNNVSITEGYFYCIRNALAHGDFDVDGELYILRNEVSGKVKGLARVKESSLLAWIDLVSMSIDDIKKAGK